MLTGITKQIFIQGGIFLVTVKVMGGVVVVGDSLFTRNWGGGRFAVEFGISLLTLNWGCGFVVEVGVLLLTRNWGCGFVV